MQDPTNLNVFQCSLIWNHFFFVSLNYGPLGFFGVARTWTHSPNMNKIQFVFVANLLLYHTALWEEKKGVFCVHFQCIEPMTNPKHVGNM